MTAAEAVAFLDRYRRLLRSARCGRGVTVAVGATDGRRASTSRPTTDVGGATPSSPRPARRANRACPRSPPRCHDRVEQLTALEYRRPGPARSATARCSSSARRRRACRSPTSSAAAGREVTIAVGEHVRLPRTYRGRDIYWWLDRDRAARRALRRGRRHRAGPAARVGAARRQRRAVATSTSNSSARRRRPTSSGGSWPSRAPRRSARAALASLVANADLKQARLLRRIDEFVDGARAGLTRSARRRRPRRPSSDHVPTELDLSRVLDGDLGDRDTARRTRGWTRSAFDRRGRVAHDGGVGRLPGLYLLGLPFLRRRRSNLIGGIGRDAVDLAGHLRGLPRSTGVRTRTVRPGLDGSGANG